MQYTENYQFRKPVIGVDDADVKDINFNSDRADTLIHNTQISLAPAYDLNETYNTGDVVMYETLMYKCKEDGVTGVWVPEKWERTTAGEEGAGGGGTSVVPNPQGEPTDTLETIEIDGTIFNIAGSGSGGDGGKGTRIDLLWDYTNDNSGNIYWSGNALTLNGDIRNYDEVVVEIVSAQGDVVDQWKSSYQWRLLVDPLINSFEPGTFTMCSYDQRSAKFQFTNTTLQKLLGNSSENGVIRVYGVTYGGGSKASEIIPISEGDGTNSRTFTFNKIPKKVTLQGYTSADGGWYESGYFIWGENFMNLIGAQYTIATGGYAGQAAISYGADGKSFTITAANAFGAFNRADNFTGMMLVDYGEGGGGNGGRTEDVLFEKPYLTANPNTITLNHAFTDYDEIQFWTVKKDDSSYYDYLPINIVPVEYLTDVMAGTMSGRTNVINISGWQPQSQYLRLRVTSASELTVVINNNNLLIRKIVGIKY